MPEVDDRPVDERHKALSARIIAGVIERNFGKDLVSQTWELKL